MNILFVGNTSGTSTSLYYFTSLVRLGHRVLPWDPEVFQTRSPLDRLRLRWHRGPWPQRVRQINERLKELCRQSHFDLVFVMGENHFHAETIRSLQAGNATRFLFHSHDNLFAPGVLKTPGFQETLATFDIVFTTKSQNVGRYQELGQTRAYFLPSAFEPAVHRPIPSSESRISQSFPVSFVGTFDYSRMAWLNPIGWDRLYVWGGGWERFPDYKKHCSKIQPQPIYYFQLADVCSHSLCALGLLREEAQDRHTQRTFEIPACGALQFAPRNEEIQSFFDEDKEIILFSTPEELKDKIDYYLKNETQRQAIARAGHERCLKSNHTYSHRVEEMLRLLHTA